MNLRNFLIPLAITTSVAAAAAAQAEQFYIVYSDSGIAWRVGLHDHESQRGQIEHLYAVDVNNAKDRYNANMNAIDQSGDRGERLVDDQNAAQEQLQNDLQAAADNRIAAYDAIYPNRWREFNNYPDFILVGYSGPCHFCTIDIENGNLAWFNFLQPYPGYAKPCLFGWHWGDHHGFREIQPARTAYRARVENSLHGRPRTALDLAFHNANRMVQTRHRSDLGHPQHDDVKFLSDHNPPVSRTGRPFPTARNPFGNGNTNSRANNNSNTRGGTTNRGGQSNSNNTRGNSNTRGGSNNNTRGGSNNKGGQSKGGNSGNGSKGKSDDKNKGH